MSDKNTQSLSNGYILEKKYKVLNVIGSGAFGITYLVEHLTFFNQYVIKEYFPQVAVRDDDKSIKPINEDDVDLFDWGLNQFIKEAQLLNQLKHPNIVTVIDIFRDNGTAYFVMPFLGEYTLSQWIDKHQQPSTEDLYQVFIPLLEGLKYIHNKQLYHSDIKPENILITSNGIPVLIDFGSARHSSLSGEDEALVLTPPYAPIEQYATQNKFKPSLDLYSLMACLYEAITKKTIPEAPERLSEDKIRKLATDKKYMDKYPAYFLSAIDKGLSLEARDRQQTAIDLQHELLDYKESPKKLSKKSYNLLYFSMFIAMVLILGVSGYFYNHQTNLVAKRIPEFDYQATLPIDGEKRAIVYFRKNNYVINVIEMDKDRNWKLVNSLTFNYEGDLDVMLREIQYKISNFGINRPLDIIIQESSMNASNVKKIVDYIVFTYGEKSKEVGIHILSEKQALEYLFEYTIPEKYKKNSVLFYHLDGKDVFIFKDVEGQYHFYNQLDKMILDKNQLGYIFIARDVINNDNQLYQVISNKELLPKLAKKLPINAIFINADIGISFLLKKGLME